MKQSPSSFSLLFQVASIMVATLLVVLVFFRMRPSISPPLSIQELVHNVIETTSPAVVMIVGKDGISGTGVTIDTQGTILTSKHLIRVGERYGIRFSDNEIEWARTLALHPTLDLALLKLEIRHATTEIPIIASQTLLQSGDFVVAFWALPSSSSFITHFGILSQMYQSLTVGNQNLSWLLITDIPFRAGYSGWSLVNLRWELIGIHTAFSADENTGWSTPIDSIMLDQWQESVR